MSKVNTDVLSITREKKLIFNRNKKQLEIIMERKIKEKNQYRKECIEGHDFFGMEVQEGKISILRWVLEVLGNPKKWDEDSDRDFEKYLNNDEMFKEVN